MQRKPLRNAIDRKHPLAAGLVAAWRFDSVRGVLTEQVGNLRVADQTGTMARLRTGYGVAGKWSTAGATDHINYGDKLARAGTLPFTVFAVVQPAGASGILVERSGNAVATLFSGFEYTCYWSSTGDFTILRYDGGALSAPHYVPATTPSNFPAGKVYRVAFSYDGATLRVYVNGRLEASAAAAQPVSINTPKFGLAAHWDYASLAYASPFRGAIHDLRIWHRCLSPAAIAQLSADPWGMYRPIPLQIRGLNLSGSAPDSTKPVISDVTPAPGTPIGRQVPLAFKLTDPAVNLARTTVLAYYPSLGTFEVVYYGSSFTNFSAGFGPQYTGTRAVISDGYQFSDVIRRGGWPAPPTIIPLGTDSAGNEND